MGPQRATRRPVVLAMLTLAGASGPSSIIYVRGFFFRILSRTQDLVSILGNLNHYQYPDADLIRIPVKQNT